ncbi:MAG: hypothetical protein AB7I79_18275 [Rhizobiaceae bacterium]
MTRSIPFAAKTPRIAALLTAALLACSSAVAQTNCGLCSKQVVINAELAACFLEKYAELVQSGEGNVMVDLSDCESRGIVPGLPGPGQVVVEPETEFLLSRAQLDCLKRKLEEPGMVLDPSATIDLESCG